MMTPQEVASHAFAKATLGGYNMAMVDEFLDLLTEDYTALYNDNAILKNKLKVLSETVEEYRATESTMRKTLLAAQQMADSMVSEAEQKRDELVADAENAAARRIAEIQSEIAAEEARLAAARQATAAFVRQVSAANGGLLEKLEQLRQLAPAAVPAEESAPVEEEPAPVEDSPVAAVVSPYDDLDPDATRRFEDLKFGKDYEIG